MGIPKAPLVAVLLRFAQGLRFQNLFLLTGGLFLFDLIIPDLIPFVDEIVLGLLTLLFASWKRKDNGNRPEGDYIDAESSRDKDSK